MSVKVEIYDWNGTIDEQRDEDRYLKYVLRELLKEDTDSGEESAFEVDDSNFHGSDGPQLSLNLSIRTAIPYSQAAALLQTVVPSYPAERREGIDHKMLRRAVAARKRGIVTGILSASWTDLITTILQENRYLETGETDAFDFIIGNNVLFCFPSRSELEEGSYNMGLEFQQRVYGRKGELLQALFRDKDFPADELHVVGSLKDLKDINLSEVAYIGDSFDDIHAFDVVGYPTLAPKPVPEFAAAAIERYGERLLRNYRDLATHWDLEHD